MIGTKISCTLWHVRYKYKDMSDRRVILAQEVGEEPKPKTVEGEAFVCTADPTGSDLCGVTESAIAGVPAKASREFTLTHVHRVCDARGLARVEEAKPS